MSLDALIAFANVCAKYEHRPTPSLFEYISDVVSDAEVCQSARVRGLMSLKKHHRQEISCWGIELLAESMMEMHPMGARDWFCKCIFGADEKLVLSREYLHRLLGYIGAEESYMIVTNSCRKNLSDLVSYRTSRVIETMLFQVGIRYVPGKYKLDVAQRSYHMHALTPECCQHLLDHRVAIGPHLWDFFHNLVEPQFVRFRLMGERFIAGEEAENLNEVVNSQSVHKLDKYRTSFLEWLCDRTFVREDEKIKYQVDQLLGTYYRGPAVLMTIEHIRTLSATFEFLRYNVVVEYRNGKRVEDRVPEIVRWSLTDVLRRMVYFVSRHTSRGELQKRLNEELMEMKGTCVSGHLNRIFNCLIGFEDILQNSCEEEYRYMLRKELDNRAKDREALLDAIVMAEWTEEATKECKEVGGLAREEVWKELPSSKDETEEPAWYVDVVYKWSGYQMEL